MEFEWCRQQGSPGQCPQQHPSVPRCPCSGTLMVAEVASRFEDLRAFMNAMAQLGFRSVNKVGL